MKTRKMYNSMVLIMLGLITLTRILMMVTNVLIGRLMGAKGILMISSFLGVTRSIEYLAFLVLLVLIIIYEVKNTDRQMFKSVAIINFLLFMIRWSFTVFYSVHLNQAIYDESKMLLEGMQFIDYVSWLGMIDAGIGVLVFLTIGILAIITLVSNRPNSLETA